MFGEGKLTQQTRHFISFLLLDGLVVESFEEHVQNQDVVSEERNKPAMSGSVRKGQCAAAAWVGGRGLRDVLLGLVELLLQVAG